MKILYLKEDPSFFNRAMQISTNVQVVKITVILTVQVTVPVVEATAIKQYNCNFKFNEYQNGNINKKNHIN